MGNSIIELILNTIRNSDNVVVDLMVNHGFKLTRIAWECINDDKLNVDHYVYKKNTLFWIYYGIKLSNNMLALYIHRPGDVCDNGFTRYNVYVFAINNNGDENTNRHDSGNAIIHYTSTSTSASSKVINTKR